MRATRTRVVGTLALVLPLFVCGSAFADPPAPGRSASPGAVPAGSGPSRAARAATAVRPVNLLCPVMTGTPVDPAFTSVWDGKLIGFSSADAKGRWDRSPSVFSRNLDSHALDLFADASGPPPAAEAQKPENVALSTPSADSAVAPRPRVAATPAARTAAPTPAAPRTTGAAAPRAGAAAPQARPTTAAAAPAPARVGTVPAPRAQTPAPRTSSAPVRAPSTTRWVDSAPEPCVGGT